MFNLYPVPLQTFRLISRIILQYNTSDKAYLHWEQPKVNMSF